MRVITKIITSDIKYTALNVRHLFHVTSTTIIDIRIGKNSRKLIIDASLKPNPTIRDRKENENWVT